jgi:hypothetical protein
MILSRFFFIGGVALALSACNTVEPIAPIASVGSGATPAGYQILPSGEMVGRWGVASYREEKDRGRTMNMARAQCKNPYVIAKGPTDGIMMHVADDPKLYELALKKGGDGKTFLGFNSQPGDIQDREIKSMSAKDMTMRFVDPDANARYGTFVYVRC